MASIISAGTTSGTSLNLSGDTSGVLQLATNGSTTAMTITTGQLVGIGTASPTHRLQVEGNSGAEVKVTRGTNSFVISLSNNIGGDVYVGTSVASALLLQTDNTERMRITSGGNVGIGTSSPSSLLHVSSSGSPAIRVASTAGSGGVCIITAQSTGNSQFDSGNDYVFSIGPEQVRFSATGGVTLQKNLSVGGATPTTSGTGITFPATQSASSNANTLDDYEEGTWTPSIGGTATYVAQDGKYTKIGNLVIASFDLSINQRGTGSTTDISGLPFTASSNSPAGVVCPVSYWASTATAINWLAFRVDANAANLSNAFTTGTQVTSTANGTIFQNGTRIIGTVSYMTAT